MSPCSAVPMHTLCLQMDNILGIVGMQTLHRSTEAAFINALSPAKLSSALLDNLGPALCRAALAYLASQRAMACVPALYGHARPHQAQPMQLQLIQGCEVPQSPCPLNMLCLCADSLHHPHKRHIITIGQLRS